MSDPPTSTSDTPGEGVGEKSAPAAGDPGKKATLQQASVASSPPPAAEVASSRRGGAASSVAAFPAAHPADRATALEVAVESDLDWRFIWRGLALSRGPVLQADVEATFRGFTASLFANGLLTSEGGRQRLSTIVPEIAYSWQRGRFRLQPVATFFWSAPESSGEPSWTTFEAGGDLSVDWGPVRIVSTHRFDLSAAPGGYFGALGVETEKESGRWTFTIDAQLAGANARLNDLYFAESVSGIDFVEAGARARFELSDRWFTALHVEASELLPARLRAASEPFLFNIGVTVGLEM